MQENLIKLKNVTYTMGEKHYYIKDLKIKNNQLYLLSAPNGSGKSVFISFLAKMIKKEEGLFEFNVPSKQIVYISANMHLVGTMDIASNLNFIIKDVYHQTFVLEQLLNTLLIAKNKTQLVNELSTGTKNKLQLSPLFVPEITNCSKLYILDEIFSGLDKCFQEQLILKIVQLANAGKTIILVEHNESIKKQITKNIFVTEKIITISDQGEIYEK